MQRDFEHKLLKFDNFRPNAIVSFFCPNAIVSFPPSVRIEARIARWLNRDMGLMAFHDSLRAPLDAYFAVLSEAQKNRPSASR